MSTEGLTIKQQHFVEAYATCNNVAQVLATAGYTTSRSPDTKPHGGFSQGSSSIMPTWRIG